MLATYYRLAKPGIVYGNLLTTLASFLYASRWHFSWLLFLSTAFGVGFVVASACVFNNYYDRDIDAKMARTRARAFAAGTIATRPALAYGALLGFFGLALLYFQANALAALVALAGWALYVLVYTPAKHRTPYATALGTLPGAVPAAAGFAAAAGALPLPAFLIFFVVLIWQMPHFYAIALYRKEEYAAAGVPTRAAFLSGAWMRAAIVAYIVVFAWLASLLYLGNFAGIVYEIIVLALTLYWLFVAFENRRLDDSAWGKRVFFGSLAALAGYALALSTAPLLP
jgi:protoheme IX farnesyltransferase